MDDVALSAQDWLLRDQLLEVHATLRASRGCTYGAATPAARALGVAGVMQPVFSCRTCASATGAPVGVCEGCVLRCHAQHVVVELGERRTWQCDCPTARSAVACCAQPVAAEVAPMSAALVPTSAALPSASTAAAPPASASSSQLPQTASLGGAGAGVGAGAGAGAGADERLPACAANRYSHNFEVCGRLATAAFRG